MLGNYLTTALRLLWRERGYAAINIFGLAIGFALCLLIIQLADYQLAVGDFHEKKDRVFRVLGPPSWGEAQYSGSTPIPLGPTLKEQLPEVEEAVRFSLGWPRLLRVGDEEGIYEEVRGVEAGVFDMFSLPLLRGDPKTVLSRPHTMVLTESLAHRLFGESDPIGQVVRVNEEFDCEVTGIVGSLPANSLLQFSALLSLTVATEPMLASGWNASAFETFVQLTPGADPAAVAAHIADIVKEARELPEATGAYALQPLKAIYFDTEVPSSVSSGGNPMYLVLCAILAVAILTIAGVNYVNLATARAGRRIHEIGVRKALGAHRGQLDAALKVIDDQWAAVEPYRPIQRNSLEEVATKLYSQDLMVGRALTLFLFLAIAVASVGLFGMAAYAAQERTKEIGIRKVFGASPGGLTVMLLRDFAKPISIAFLLSVPIAYGLANQWLQEFAYRVEIGVGLFLVSGALSFVIAGLTVGHQAMRAALTNPIETLRTE